MEAHEKDFIQLDEHVLFLFYIIITMELVLVLLKPSFVLIIKPILSVYVFVPKPVLSLEGNQLGMCWFSAKL